MSHKSLSNRQNFKRMLIEGGAFGMAEKVKALVSNLENADDLNGLDHPGEVDHYISTILDAFCDINSKLDAILAIQVRKSLTSQR